MNYCKEKLNIFLQRIKQVKKSYRHLPKVLFLGSLLVCLCFGNTSKFTLGDRAVASPITQLVQQGIDRYNNKDLQAAIDFWQQALTDAHSGADEENTIRKYLARAYQQLGQNDQAIAQLEQIVTNYRHKGDRVSVGRMLSEQAQVYSSIGQHRRAIAFLCGNEQKRESEALEAGEKIPNPKSQIPSCDKDSALEIARQESDDLGVAAALGSLGNAYRLQGKYTQATRFLVASLEIAQKISHPSYIVAALNSLGNVYTSLALRDLRYASSASTEGDETSRQKFRLNASSYDAKAVEYFQAMLDLAHKQQDRIAQLRSLLNQVAPLQRHPNTTQARVNNTIEQALAILPHLADSQDKVYYTIRLADLLQRRTLDTSVSDANATTYCPKSESSQATELLKLAVAIAQRIQYRRSESFAYGRLAHVYECRGDYAKALGLTQQAQLAALDKDSLYQWEWQAGRILKAQGRKNEALKAYENAVKTLKSVRTDLAIANRDLQLDFRDTVEPVYRQLAELWLDRSMSAKTSSTSEYLEPALATIDELRIAELQNYLGNECELPLIEKPVALVNRNTAVFNSIILKQGIAIILTLPKGEKQFVSKIHWIPIDSSAAIDLVNKFRIQLEKRSDRANTYKQKARQLYDWLIRPFDSDLVAAKIKTLVFIQDGILRSIPMAALDDGKQFLIQKYAIAYTPSLALTNPTPLDSQKFRVLAFGLTEPSEVDNQTFFPPLQNVPLEIESIEATIPGSKGFLNKAFTRDRLQQELKQNNYPLLHLATHGKFGIDSRDTFLVTGNTNRNYNETLTMNELYQLVKNTGSANQLKLLTLSACETAAGSDRDALGIAGIALQAGVQSAMATLWQVDDLATTQLITKFYQSLRQGMSKAEALQATQTAWLKAHPKGSYNHPSYWAPFILTGNWL